MHTKESGTRGRLIWGVECVLVYSKNRDGGKLGDWNERKDINLSNCSHFSTLFNTSKSQPRMVTIKKRAQLDTPSLKLRDLYTMYIHTYIHTKRNAANNTSCFHWRQTILCTCTCTCRCQLMLWIELKNSSTWMPGCPSDLGTPQPREWSHTSDRAHMPLAHTGEGQGVQSVQGE